MVEGSLLPYPPYFALLEKAPEAWEKPLVQTDWDDTSASDPELLPASLYSLPTCPLLWSILDRRLPGITVLMLEPFQLAGALRSALNDKDSLSPAPVSVTIAIPGISRGFRDIWNAGMAGSMAPLRWPCCLWNACHTSAALWLGSWLWVYGPTGLWVRKGMSFKNHELLEESAPVTQWSFLYSCSLEVTAVRINRCNLDFRAKFLHLGFAFYSVHATSLHLNLGKENATLFMTCIYRGCETM